MGTVRIPLSSRKYPNLYAIIDEEDYELVGQYSWSPRSQDQRYAQAYIGGGRKDRRVVLMHRLIMGFPKTGMIDHIDGDGLNNSRSNLRLVTPGENTVNTLILPKGISGFKGVTQSRSGRWRSRFRRHVIGTFTSPVAAAVAYDRYARSVYGDFVKTNEDLGLLTPSEAEMDPEPFRTGRKG